MPVVESFFTPAETELSREFMANGYVIRDADNLPALDELRAALVGLACRHLGCDAPQDLSAVVNTLHERVRPEKLNDLRLAVFRGMNEHAWLRPTYYALGRSIIDGLVGNELAMQNRVNLSVQMPNDNSSLLGEGGMSALYEQVKGDLVWLNMPYGKVLVFNSSCLHGNVVNRTLVTRWSLNCRFTGLFTPYSSYEKKLGSFYVPITTRAASRIGMRYEQPGGFEE